MVPVCGEALVTYTPVLDDVLQDWCSTIVLLGDAELEGFPSSTLAVHFRGTGLPYRQHQQTQISLQLIH